MLFWNRNQRGKNRNTLAVNIAGYKLSLTCRTAQQIGANKIYNKVLVKIKKRCDCDFLIPLVSLPLQSEKKYKKWKQ
jgi:hypothetical protein